MDQPGGGVESEDRSFGHVVERVAGADHGGYREGTRQDRRVRRRRRPVAWRSRDRWRGRAWPCRRARGRRPPGCRGRPARVSAARPRAAPPGPAVPRRGGPRPAPAGTGRRAHPTARPWHLDGVHPRCARRRSGVDRGEGGHAQGLVLQEEEVRLEDRRARRAEPGDRVLTLALDRESGLVDRGMQPLPLGGDVAVGGPRRRRELRAYRKRRAGATAKPGLAGTPRTTPSVGSAASRAGRRSVDGRLRLLVEAALGQGPERLHHVGGLRTPRDDLDRLPDRHAERRDRVQAPGAHRSAACRHVPHRRRRHRSPTPSARTWRQGERGARVAGRR